MQPAWSGQLVRKDPVTDISMNPNPFHHLSPTYFYDTPVMPLDPEGSDPKVRHIVS